MYLFNKGNSWFPTERDEFEQNLNLICRKFKSNKKMLN